MTVNTPSIDDRPAFSVIIPTKDRPALLARAVRSALTQREATFEIIVADDGTGVDDNAEQNSTASVAVRSFRTGGVGQVPARNMALRRAAGRWVAWLDDDDWWATPDHLAALGAKLEDGPCLAYASGRIVREDVEQRRVAEDLVFRAHADPASIRANNTLMVPGIAYDLALHTRFGPFDEALAVYWDWDWYLRLAEAGIAFVDGGGDGVRVSARGDNVSSPGNRSARRQDLARLCAKHGLSGIELKNHEVIALEQTAGVTRR